MRHILTTALMGVAALAVSGCYGWGPHHRGWNGGHYHDSDWHEDSRGRGQSEPGTRARCDDDPDSPAPPCGEQ